MEKKWFSFLLVLVSIFALVGNAHAQKIDDMTYEIYGGFAPSFIPNLKTGTDTPYVLFWYNNNGPELIFFQVTGFDRNNSPITSTIGFRTRVDQARKIFGTPMFTINQAISQSQFNNLPDGMGPMLIGIVYWGASQKINGIDTTLYNGMIKFSDKVGVLTSIFMGAFDEVPDYKPR